MTRLVEWLVLGCSCTLLSTVSSEVLVDLPSRHESDDLLKAESFAEEIMEPGGVKWNEKRGFWDKRGYWDKRGFWDKRSPLFGRHPLPSYFLNKYNISPYYDGAADFNPTSKNEPEEKRGFWDKRDLRDGRFLPWRKF
ncbi:hypothetical protein ACJMK2_022801 [Sinanodonta woodiana]|uniref:Uncharacterized protein n=1 Tax=Sinanodonta woodiana TaxID=1069815 RepID=A0ABD3TM83_SINWO